MPPKTMLAGFPSNSAGYQVFPHTSEFYYLHRQRGNVWVAL